MGGFKVALINVDKSGVPDWVSASLEREGVEVLARRCTTAEELVQFARDADMLWNLGGNHIITGDTLDALPRCGAIMRSGSGTDDMPVAEATRLGIVVANTPGAHCDEVSDHAIGLLFAVVRQTSIHDRLLREGTWDARRGLPRWHLCGQTLGLVGFGYSARLVAEKMSGFKMTTLAYDPYVSADAMSEKGARKVGLDDVLSQSDLVLLHCPFTKETYHLIGERELRLMKPRAILVNTARGPVVDEPALIRALTEGWIAAAGLDVFEQEPVDPDNPLLKLDNVVATPHIAGASDRSGETRWQLSVETVVALARGHWPRSYVNHGVKPRLNLT